MSNKEDLIETYISNAKRRINSLPRFNEKGIGTFISNGLKNVSQNGLKVSKIIKEEDDNLIDFVNLNFVKDWTDFETSEFVKLKDEKFLELKQKWIKVSLRQMPV